MLFKEHRIKMIFGDVNLKTPLPIDSLTFYGRFSNGTWRPIPTGPNSCDWENENPVR